MTEITIVVEFHGLYLTSYRSSHPEVFLGKGVLKICSKFTGDHPCRSAISIKFHGKSEKMNKKSFCLTTSKKVIKKVVQSSLQRDKLLRTQHRQIQNKVKHLRWSPLRTW